jgi:hypothetical protein
VQLEIGSVATPLEKPDPQQDLAKCQRFFYASTAANALGASVAGYIVAGVGVSISQPFPTMMRAAPTLTPSNVTLSNVTGPAYQGCPDGVYAAVSGVAAGGVLFSFNFTASADL